MQLARYYLERLIFGVNNYLQQRELIADIVHKQFVLFPELAVKWPLIPDLNDLEQAKLLFRLANTQYKKAMDYFVLDGFVTENVQMRQEMSKLYKYLAMMDPEKARVFAMTERRRELLDHLLKELNPKAYEATCQELQAELSDIYQSLFDLKYDELKLSKNAPSKADLDLMNNLGNKSIHFSNIIIESVVSKEEKFEYAQAVLNLTLSSARIYSKLYDKERSVQLKYLEQSYREYEKIKAFITDFKKFKQIANDNDLPQGMKDQYRMSMEMYEMLPIKISKLNAQL